MNFLRIASSLSDRPDYGMSDAALPRGIISRVLKTPNIEEYCVVSDKKDSNWSGGCYPSRPQADARLVQVEQIKHIKQKGKKRKKKKSRKKRKSSLTSNLFDPW